MNSFLLVHALVAGGGLLALWIYVRLGERRPKSPARVCAHVIAAFIGLVFAPNAVGWIIGGTDSAPLTAVGLFGVFLPTMTYVFVAALLCLETLQRALYMR